VRFRLIVIVRIAAVASLATEPRVGAPQMKPDYLAGSTIRPLMTFDAVVFARPLTP
jgi:hypothetical protein